MKSLLTIAPPEPGFPRDLIDARGGFLWWYLDAFDQDGNGVVLIWSYGLPFLPGYASAARGGAPQRAGDRPSLNISIYRDGKLDFYSLQEFEPGDARWDHDEWRFGRSTMRTRVLDGHRIVEAELDLDVPGNDDLTLRGNVRVDGVARAARPGDEYDALHDWAPMTGPARAHVDLEAGDARYQFDARGYFDGNCGAVPLHETGIYEWTWGRAPFEDRERIYYILWGGPNEPPEAHGLEIDATGRLESFPIDVEIPKHGRALAGMRFPASLRLSRDGELWLAVTTGEILDDGPFYLRYFQEFDDGVAKVHGKGEICRTDRIDLPVHRPLVRMRVERVGDRNSMWLPLFTGPRSGRVKRLLGQWMGGRRG